MKEREEEERGGEREEGERGGESEDDREGERKVYMYMH